MKVRILQIVLFLLLSTTALQAQKVALEKAEKKYENFAFVDAIKIYERIAGKGYKDADMFKRLGDSYYFRSEYKEAAQWYTELFQMNVPVEPEYHYRYAQSLKSTGDLSRAEEIMNNFVLAASDDRRAVLIKSNPDYKEQILSNSGRYNIEDAGINSAFSDYGGAFIENKFIFTTDRDSGGVFKRKFKWTGNGFSNFYAAEVQSDGTFKKAEKYASVINSRFNESSAVFTKDGKTMYFTRNNFIKGKKGRSKDDMVLLKLYRASFDGLRWDNVEELSINSNDFSNAHPALSPDDKTLYFASNRPGSAGQSDIYKVEIKSDGSLGEPVNLGPQINTEGKETFPFVSDDNELYFASDGHPGLGGLDIFVAELSEAGIRNLQNVGEPVNSPFDDFAYLLDSASRNGFFSSNRPTGKGYDDIYKFTETRKLKCEQIIEGILRDEENNQPLADVMLTLYDKEMKEVRTIYTAADGTYSFGSVECGSIYHIRAQKPDFETEEVPQPIPSENGSTVVPIVLGKKMKKIEPGTDLARTFDIVTIYFDLDKANIRPEAAFQLEKILAVMLEYPTMTVDVRSHTDSRQSHAYNQKLSDRRAKSTIEWLVKNGVERSRLSGKGYGETQLVNECADGVPCSEEQHQLNRRSQFIIKSM